MPRNLSLFVPRFPERPRFGPMCPPMLRPKPERPPELAVEDILAACGLRPQRRPPVVIFNGEFYG